MKKVLEDYLQLNDNLVKSISRNIDDGIKEEEFYLLKSDIIIDILKVSKISNMSLVRILIHNMLKYHSTEGLNFFQYININEKEDETMKEKGIMEALAELNDIPFFKEVLNMIEQKNKEINKDQIQNQKEKESFEDENETDILVDWEKLYESEKEENANLKNELIKLRIKCDINDKALKSKAPTPKEFQKKDIKSIYESFEKRDEKKARRLLMNNPSLIFVKDVENNQTLLHTAIDSNWIDGVDIIQEVGIGVEGILEVENQHHECPLAYAFRKKNYEIMKHLVLLGAKVDSKMRNGNSVLMEATKNKQYDIVEFLISHGAVAKGNGSNTQEIMSFFINQKLYDIVEHFIAKGVNQNSINDALIWSARKGLLDTTMYLISKEAIIESKTVRGMTALMMACEYGKLDIAKQLMYQGANIEVKDNKGRTSLIVASINGRLEIVKLLTFRGAKIDAKDSKGKTALIHACENGKSDVIKHLVSKGADIEATNENGLTSFMIIATEEKCDKCLIELFISNGANIEAKDNEGNTAIMIIQKAYDDNERGRSKVCVKNIEFLIQKGGKYKEKEDFEGAEIMNACACGCREKDMEDIISRGANIDIQNKYGWTPLICAAIAGNIESMKTLLSKGANTEAEDKLNQTALVKACKYDRFDIVQLLISNGAKVNGRALSKACKYCGVDTIKFLFSSGYVIQPEDPVVKSAVNRRDLVELLLLNGANVNASGYQSGKTALMKTCKNGRFDFF